MGMQFKKGERVEEQKRELPMISKLNERYSVKKCEQFFSRFGYNFG